MYWAWDSEVLIRVGTGEERREFRGPRHQLAQQSGYFKSLLESSTSNEITLPSVSPDVFAPILRYVTTGYLDLNPENVYTVLLATHILHMPRAVDICRSYLMRQEESRRLPLLVRPIPSRKYLPPSLYWPPPPLFPPPQFYPPPPPPTSTVIPSVPAEPLPSTSLAADTAPENGIHSTRLDTSPSPPPTSTTSKKIKEVVKDIACCDGPVRFKRVLNANYGYVSDTDPKDGDRAAEGRQLYVCTFCKHTFKSHYCYRKHTRRHINPVSVKPIEAETKDMNVQYYPCKTCGSKFPSYYFVHKHRKQCHLNENEAEEKLSNNADCTDDTLAP